MPLVALLGSLLVVDAGPVGATHKFAAPTNLVATAGNGQVSLSVDAVAVADRYRFQYGEHPSGALTSSARSSSTSRTITGLTNGQTYRVRAQASVALANHQTSDWSGWVTFTPRVPLNDPAGLSVSGGNAALSLSWTASTSTGVTGYDVHYTSASATGSSPVADGAPVTTGLASAGWVAFTRSGTTASQTITGLSNGTPYRVRVRAKSSTGLSGWVFGAGTPRAASATLSGPATVVEGQALKLRVTFSPATTVQGNVEVTATRVTSESGDHAPSIYLFSGVGTTNGSINFATHHDDDQDDETFTVTLTEAPTGYSIGSPSSVSVTIVDDDKPSVSLSASPNPVREGDPVTVTAQLSHATVNALTIPVRLSRGTSESGDHGTLTSINVAAGASSGSATVSTVEDADDDEETFTVSLGEALPATVTRGSPTSVAVTISEAIEVSLGPAEVFVAEGERARLLLAFSTAPPGVQSKAFAVTTERVTSEPGDHSEPQWVSYYDAEGGDRSTQVFIDTNVDGDSVDEVFTVELDAAKLPDGYVAGAQSKVTVTVLEPREASLSVSEQRVLAGHPVTVTVTLARPAGADTQVWVQVAPGTAGTDDYSAFWYNRPGILAADIAAGSTSGTAQIRTKGNDRDVCDETFTVSLYKLPRYSLGDPSSVEVAIAGTHPAAAECTPKTPADTGTGGAGAGTGGTGSSGGGGSGIGSGGGGTGGGGGGAQQQSPTNTGTGGGGDGDAERDIERLWGADRYATSLRVVERVADAGNGTLDTVVLASGHSFADALAAGPLAASLDNAALLLTAAGGLPEAAVARLARLGVTEVIAVGSTDHITDAALQALNSLDAEPERITADTPYAVSAAVARRIGQPDTLGADLGRTVIVASGKKFPDALAAGPLAGEGPHPVLYADTGTLHDDVKAYLAEHADHVIIMGGTAAVTAEIQQQITDIDQANRPGTPMRITRFAGDDRYHTAALLARWLTTTGTAAQGHTCFTTATAGLASGLNAADAAASAPLLARRCAPLLLTQPDQIPEHTKTFLRNTNTIIVLGGTKAITPTALADLDR